MARSLRSLRQVATLRHGHMARRSASLLHSGHKGVCEHIWLRYKNFDPSCFDPIQKFGVSTWGLTLIFDPVPSTYFCPPKWITASNWRYKNSLTTLGILPLTKEGYDVNQLKVPDLSYSVRGEIVFHISRPRKAVVQQAFVYRTTRLVNLLKIDINCDKQTLKAKLLKIFWPKFKSFDEQIPCSWSRMRLYNKLLSW